MKPMRRLIASLSALSLLGAFAGCNHIAGVCDCDPCSRNCCNTCAGMGYTPAGPAGLMAGGVVTPGPLPMGKTPEDIKEMPKEVDKDKDKDKKEDGKEKAPDKAKEDGKEKM
jgi:hypothetical protein